MVPSPLDMSTNKISDDIKLSLAFNRCTNSNRNCVTELPTGSAKCSNVQVGLHFLPLYLLTIPFQCLPASETIKTPDQDSGRLCGNTAEMFIISTACSVVEYRKTHSRTTLSFFGLPRLPTSSFSSLPPRCISAWKWNRSFWILSLRHWKSLSVCDAERMRTEAQGDMAHFQHHCGLQRGILYAGARLA